MLPDATVGDGESEAGGGGEIILSTSSPAASDQDLLRTETLDMKLMLLAALVGVGFARPQFSIGSNITTPIGNFGSGLNVDAKAAMDEFSSPMSSTERSGFLNYIDGLRKIFANADNHQELQQIFQSPQMQQWFFSTLHKQPSAPFPGGLATNWNDVTFTRDEWMAWYNAVRAITKTMNMEPVVEEEWALTSGKKGVVEPSDIYVMLRDGVANRFFPSFMALAFSEATKDLPGEFFSAAKQRAFESLGPWASIANLAPISDSQIKTLADQIEKVQGEEAAENFMTDMGMNKNADKTLPVQTLDGKGEVQIKVADGSEPASESDEEPFIAPEAPILITTGETMPAAKVVEDPSMTPVEGAPVEVTVPGGAKIVMPLGAVDTSSDESPEQPMATIEGADGSKFQMPVVSAEKSADGTSTTVVMTQQGSTLEVTLTTPEKEEASPEGVLNDEGLGATVMEPAKVKMATTGQEVDAMATPAEKSEASDDACLEEDGCKAMEINLNGAKMTLPVAAEDEVKEDLTMEVFNTQTDQSTKLTNVKTKLTDDPTDSTAEIMTVTGETEEGTKLEVTMKESKLDNEEGMEPQPEGEIAIEDPQGKPLATAEIQSITSSKGADGQRQTKITGLVNNTPTMIVITSGAPEGSEDLSADEMEDIKVQMVVNGKAEEVKVVKGDSETLTGETADGTTIEMPVADNDEKSTITMTSAAGQSMELPIVSKQTTADKSAEQLKAQSPNGQAQMTITVTGLEKQ